MEPAAPDQPLVAPEPNIKLASFHSPTQLFYMDSFQCLRISLEAKNIFGWLRKLTGHHGAAFGESKEDYWQQFAQKNWLACMKDFEIDLATK